MTPSDQPAAASRWWGCFARAHWVGTAAVVALGWAPVAASAEPGTPAHLLDQFCARCHDDDQLSGGLSFSTLQATDIASGAHLGEWEKILRMTRRGEMPPLDRPQPTPAVRAQFTQWLAQSLDSRATAHPDPGRATLRRLNRSEYANAVRDLLALDIDVRDGLPADDSGYGFDNIADVLSVTPTLMDRYLAVAGRISRIAVGKGPAKPYVTSFVVPKDGSVLNQGIPSWDERVSDDLPLDSRGGAAFSFYAPHDGVYEISGWLNANTNNEVDRLPETRVSRRIALGAGPHRIGVTFRKQFTLDETVQTLHNDLDYVVMPLQPPTQLPLMFVVDGAAVAETTVPSYHMSPRFSQTNWPRDVLQIDVEGPYDVKGPGLTPSRRKIFSCQPSKVAAEAACARRIVATLSRQAWRRPVTTADIEPVLRVYGRARQGTDFETGIEAAVEAILVSPSFLFLRERDPAGAEPGTVHRLDDLAFASRLSLFLWSSLPDDELLKLATKGRLRKPQVLAAQVDRMLADPRARALTTNFAGQWLYLRNLDYHRPDVYLFPNFNTRLREAMQRETELFFTSILRENRSLLDFIDSDYTFLNERLADHYGIKGVQGTAFRRVQLPAASGRGGLLGQASILTVTSYGNHTSVVKRGQWILANLLAAPPPPPPADVPALKSTVNGRALSAREQLELHRGDPVCASCHAKMDPLGYALENFDPVGVFRTQDAGAAIDVTATLADGTVFRALPGLRGILMDRKDDFTGAFTERLLTYALARGVEAPDMPTVRAITRAAARDNYRIRTIILGIVMSEPFNLRKIPNA
jgi:mono/diheme cytochrome c family protein